MPRPTPDPARRSSSSKPRALCFIDMPFGRKKDPQSAVEIDFDQIYETAIKPSVEDVGLECLRGDEERTGGIIHVPMFARLLLAEYVIADLTLGNPNVFYELGVRHSARPRTTIPIYATLRGLPFDVGMIRAIPYHLVGGALTEAGASELREALADRLHAALEGPPVTDSPLFELIQGFPGIELPREFTDVFRQRVKYSEEFRGKLREARSRGGPEASLAALREIRAGLGRLVTADRGVLVDLLLSFRDVSAWDDMVGLCEAMPVELQRAATVRHQWALALNRRNRGSDRGRAAEIVRQLLTERGADAETLGILGRIC
ncbi:MAG: TRAFs-binding domain-containing protein, partial [Gemmatimonadales bacterium]